MQKHQKTQKQKKRVSQSSRKTQSQNERIYSEHKDTIEKIAVQRSNAMSHIVGLPVDDLKQEIRTVCIAAISKYRNQKGSLYSFLLRCVNNFLINLKRNGDIYSRWNPPCVWKGCIFYNKRTKECKFFHDDNKEECKSYARYIKKFNERTSITSPQSINDIMPFVQQTKTYSIDGEIIKNDLERTIIERLSLMEDGIILVSFYKKWIHEGKDIPLKYKKIIRLFTKMIIGEDW